ncbi:MAG TPA: hypothetical protein VG845_02135 [Dehalococcoidia bacterium]|nr:hypothetical protein [Dehalococcoidia bacterium]
MNRNLAIGNPDAEDEWRWLRAQGVCGVVDLCGAATDLGTVVRRNGMRYLQLPLANGHLPDGGELHIVTSWILQRVYEDGPVLICDDSDLGNDAVVACAALIKRGASLRRASVQLRNASAGPLSDLQLDLLERFAGEMAVSARR